MNFPKGKKPVRIAATTITMMLLLPCMVYSYAEADEASNIPYYFVAIHNEPYHFPGGEERIEKAYGVLQRMIENANEHNVKLTLMFTAQWADYIVASGDRLAELES